MKPSQVSKRETGTDRIRPTEYPIWDRGLKLPSGAFEAEVERQRTLLEAESSRTAGSRREADTSAATTAIQVVLGELGPIVADICKHVDGAERDHMLQEIVTFAEGVASAAKASAKRSGAVLLGPPDNKLHGAQR